MARIIYLESSNIKRLTAVAVTPEPHINKIGGLNGEGKSSLLDSIAMALGGGPELLEQPVHEGAKKGSVVIKLDDGLVIKRTFTAAGGTALVIENAEGARYQSPQAMMDKLTGKQCFDPFAFTRLKPAEQAATLKRLVNLDFTTLDAERAKNYNARTLVNRDLDRLKLDLERMPSYPEVTEEVSTVDLMRELGEADAHNSQEAVLTNAWSEAVKEEENARTSVSLQKATIASLEAKLKAAKETLVAYEKGAAGAKAEADKAALEKDSFVAIDTTGIRERLASAAETNKKAAANAARWVVEAKLQVALDESDSLTRSIEKIDEEKERQLKEAKFPIDGLSFGENGVTYNNHPFSQASTAEQIRVSVAMGAALNPKLRVMIIRDGALIDKRSMQLLQELVVEHNLQLFIEIAGEGEGCQIVIEDGRLKGAPAPESDQPAKPEPEPATTKAQGGASIFDSLDD